MLAYCAGKSFRGILKALRVFPSQSGLLALILELATLASELAGIVNRAGGRLLLVGGTVRDLLLGQVPLMDSLAGDLFEVIPLMGTGVDPHLLVCGQKTGHPRHLRGK